MAGGQPSGTEGRGRDRLTATDERSESTDLARGCLWGVALGVLFWLLAVASVVCAVTNCLH